MPDDVCSADGQSEDDKSQDNSSSPQPALLLFLDDLPPAAQGDAAKGVLEQLAPDVEPVLETGGKVAGGGLLRVLGMAASLLTISSDDDVRGSDGHLWFNSINPTTGKLYSSAAECREVLNRTSAAEYQRYQLQKAAEASGYFSDGTVNECTATCQPQAAAQPAAVSTSPAPATPVMPSGLSTQDKELWKNCQAQHEEYKQTQQASGSLSARINKVLDDLANNRPGSAQQKVDVCNWLGELIAILEQLHRQRKKYVDSGCDKFDWFNSGATEASRKQSHLGEMDAVDRQIKNAYKARQKYCP
jgi:hypothetical protein